MFLGDFAAFYFMPMALYIFIYSKIIYTLSKNELKCKSHHINESMSLLS